MHRIGIIVLLLGTLGVSFARADEVTLQNGDRLTGTIVKSDAKVLVIKSDSEGDVNVQWDAIRSIQSTQPLYLGLKDGQMIVGTVATNAGRFVVDTKNAGTVTTAKDDVVTVRNESEEAAYNAQIDRLRNPHLTDFWSGMLDTGLSLTRGNSATLTYTLSAKAIRTTTRDKITAYTTAIYGANDNVSPSQTTAHEIRGGVRGDVNINDRWFAFATTDFDSNALQHLDLQNVLAGGAGYHMVKTANTTFDLSGGAGYNQQYFSAYTLPNPTPPPATTAFAAVTQRNATALVGEALATKLNSRTTFDEDFTFYPGIGGAGGYRFVFNSTASTKLKNWLGWQVTFGDNYISNPPFGIKGNDLLLSTGLRLTFGGFAQ